MQRRQRHSRLGHPSPFPFVQAVQDSRLRTSGSSRLVTSSAPLRPSTVACPGARPACPLSSVLVSSLPAFMKNNKRPTRVPTGMGLHACELERSGEGLASLRFP
eukprot:jgi/Mesvir1/5990/Mv25242-RA.1